jgi:hypothetical protein
MHFYFKKYLSKVFLKHLYNPPFFFCVVRGPRSWCFGRTTALRLFVQPLWWRWAVFLPSFTSNGAPVERNWQGKTDNSEKNLSHFVHHKSHMDLTWDRTRASVVRGRRLTAWAMARPIVPVGVNSVWFEIMSPWRWTQIKGSKHVGEWNYTINVIELYICRNINIELKCTEWIILSS